MAGNKDLLTATHCPQVPADEVGKYAYHGTTAAKLILIESEGLTPQPAQSWHEQVPGYEGRDISWFAAVPEYPFDWATKNAEMGGYYNRQQPSLLRVPQELMTGIARGVPGELDAIFYFCAEQIDPRLIEISTHEGWLPLSDALDRALDRNAAEIASLYSAGQAPSPDNPMSRFW